MGKKSCFARVVCQHTPFQKQKQSKNWRRRKSSERFCSLDLFCAQQVFFFLFSFKEEGTKAIALSLCVLFNKKTHATFWGFFASNPRFFLWGKGQFLENRCV